MISINFCDWAKNRPKKHYNKLHEMRIFELIFSRKLTQLGLELGDFEKVTVFCLADPNKAISYNEDLAISEIQILVPYNFMTFLNLDSTEEKFLAFSELIHLYIEPVLKKYSRFSTTTISAFIEEALQEIVKQNYEAVFLVDKTPKKSPGKKRMAILKGIHRSEGFQLRCEVYDEKGLRIADQLLVEEVGNEIVYSRFLGTLKWENDNLIVVRSKTSSWKSEVNVD